MFEKAKWIWWAEGPSRGYNQTVFFRKTFSIDSVQSASLLITADSRYRVTVNGTWVNDGPSRSWPFAFQYDVIDITPFLTRGNNAIEVTARYFGIGSCHLVPQEGGLLAELRLRDQAGEEEIIGSDRTWLSCKAPGWLVYTPKISLGLEPSEIIDARDAGTELIESVEKYEIGNAPWQNLRPRDVALLTREPREIKSFVGATFVDPSWNAVTFSPIRMFFPGLMEANGATCMAGGFATIIRCDQDGEIELNSYPPAEGPTITVNGKWGKDGKYHINQGDNLMLALFEPWGHHNKEQGVRLIESMDCELLNPLDSGCKNPWAVFRDHAHDYHEQDGKIRDFNPPERERIRDTVQSDYDRIVKSVKDQQSFREQLGRHVLPIEDEAYQPVPNPHWQFEERDPLGDASDNVEAAAALAANNAAPTTICPTKGKDIELAYDLGEQTVGYIDIEVTGDSGTVIDVFLIEHIDRDGKLQHTWATRNGIRFTCKQGANRFLSLGRRAGRYVFVTIRNQSGEVAIRSIRVIESTYPVIRKGQFICSDANLTQIWAASLTTLKLCMEDVYTDCPLYEQTLWVGDARNEALFSMTAYGQTDIMRRCIRLAAQGLEKHPIAPSHAPTSNGECILPAWAFLWGISVWDYYYYTGEEEFLLEVWPYVLRNLKGAESLTDERGLFSGPFWNMFDWTDIDAGHKTVLHNSMHLVGCMDAAIKCAKVVGDKDAISWLTEWRKDMVNSINKLWHEQAKAYRDSVHDDGELSEEFSIHTHFLAVLYGIANEEIWPKAIKNFLEPPEGMTQIGSPFAIQYMFEALEKINHEERIIDSILENYIPMLRSGATTVWEQFPNGSGFNPEGFPTRSHCHAWSSAPIHFLNRIILGIRQTEPGGAAYEISPWIRYHEWADGASATIKGKVSVRWEKREDSLHITVRAPKGVRLDYRRNSTHDGLKVFMNDAAVETVSGYDVEVEI